MKKKLIAMAVLIIIGFAAMLFWQYFAFSDGKLHLVFCDVGQGDAIFIRTPNKTDILLDGGGDKKVLDCLSHHMPFWDRRLELVILSHPHQDHFAGLLDVLDRYTVVSFVTEKLFNDSLAFRALQKRIEEKSLGPRYIFAGDSLKTADRVNLWVLSPTGDFLASTSPGEKIGESGEFGSLIIHLSYGEFDALLTSDSQKNQVTGALEKLISKNISLEVLQVPHHGSKYGLSIAKSDLARLAVISVGKNNRYGHPNSEVIKLLRDNDIKTVRTDRDGEIELVSDGQTWKLKN